MSLSFVCWVCLSAWLSWLSWLSDCVLVLLSVCVLVLLFVSVFCLACLCDCLSVFFTAGGRKYMRNAWSAY